MGNKPIGPTCQLRRSNFSQGGRESNSLELGLRSQDRSSSRSVIRLQLAKVRVVFEYPEGETRPPFLDTNSSGIQYGGIGRGPACKNGKTSF
jgi:hypothetical protein